MSHTVVLANLVERVLDFGLGVGVDHLTDLVHVQVDVLGRRGLADSWAVALVLFHELLQELQVVVAEFLPVHRNVHVQLLDLTQDPQIEIRLLLDLLLTQLLKILYHLINSIEVVETLFLVVFFLTRLVERR